MSRPSSSKTCSTSYGESKHARRLSVSYQGDVVIWLECLPSAGVMCKSDSRAKRKICRSPRIWGFNLWSINETLVTIQMARFPPTLLFPLGILFHWLLQHFLFPALPKLFSLISDIRYPSNDFPQCPSVCLSHLINNLSLMIFPCINFKSSSSLCWLYSNSV